MTRTEMYATPAVVARIPGDIALRFLRLAPHGGLDWVADRADALKLPSLREAIHVAGLLPEDLKPFGLLDRPLVP